MPALSGLNDLLVRHADEAGLVPRWHGLRVVAADGSVLMPAVRASHLPRAAARDQRILGMFLPGAGGLVGLAAAPAGDPLLHPLRRQRLVRSTSLHALGTD